MHLMRKRAGYIEGWRMLHKKGMRPASHAFIDDLLVYRRNTPESRRLTFKSGPCFRVRNVAVYPPINEEFRRGVDIISPYVAKTRHGGYQLGFGASNIPDEAFGRQNVVLSIDPDRLSNIRKIKSVYYIDPDSLVVVPEVAHPVMTFGKVDEKSRLPTFVPQTNEAFAELDWNDVRFIALWREGGVWPIVRGVSFMGGRRAIDISCRFDAEYTMPGEKAG